MVNNSKGRSSKSGPVIAVARTFLDPTINTRTLAGVVTSLAVPLIRLFRHRSIRTVGRIRKMKLVSYSYSPVKSSGFKSSSKQSIRMTLRSLKDLKPVGSHSSGACRQEGGVCHG